MMNSAINFSTHVQGHLLVKTIFLTTHHDLMGYTVWKLYVNNAYEVTGSIITSVQSW